MAISRRTLFRHLGVGAAATVGLPAIARAGAIEEAFGGRLETPDGSGPVRLHKNENPFGPSSRVVDAIRGAAASVAGRYPDGPDESLRKKLADLHDVTPDRVVLGCGSDDVLGMVVSALGSGRTVITAHPTYDGVIERARRSGAEVATVPLRADRAHDLDRMLSRVDAATRLVYICNPNNPTASITRRHDLDAFIQKLPDTVSVVIDEAYHHYVSASSDYASFLDRPLNDRRIIVTRSFSTVHGLAGLRIGYGIAHAEVLARLENSGLPCNVNAVAALAAMAALDDTEHVRTAVNRNADLRQEFCNQANARMLRTIDSHANFVLLNTGRPAVEMIEHFRKNDVLVAGPFHSFDHHIRVSLGTQAEMAEFWRVWDLLPPTHVMIM